MKYKCNCCGEVFDEDDANYVREYVGEFWGTPAYNNYMTCPNCDEEDFEEYREEDEEEGDEE